MKSSGFNPPQIYDAVFITEERGRSARELITPAAVIQWVWSKHWLHYIYLDLYILNIW